MFKRYLPLLLIVAAMALVFAMGWHKHLTLENLYDNREALKGFIARNIVLSVLVYMAIYIVAVALSLPGGLLLTVTGGFLFGWMIGAPATIVAATIGATLIFLIAKTSLGEALAERAGPWVGKLRAGFQENALSYLLFLRLVPAFPFFVVNLAPALLGVRLRTYVVGTLIGIIPGTTAFSFAGSGLDSVFAAQGKTYEACKAKLAAGERVVCKLDVSLGALVTRELIIAFALLGVVALIPVLYKRFGRGGPASP
ncbi:MAG: TVP38/TMEM64 family protein [Hyphomicrobiaceae bacterium]